MTKHLTELEIKKSNEEIIKILNDIHNRSSIRIKNMDMLIFAYSCGLFIEDELKNLTYEEILSHIKHKLGDNYAAR